MLLYRVRKGKLQGLTTPLNFGSGTGSDIDERTFAQLEREGVTEVYYA